LPVYLKFFWCLRFQLSCKISYNNNKVGEDDDYEIKTFLNLWYSPKNNKGKSVIVEFTYDYDAIKKKEEGKELNKTTRSIRRYKASRRS